MKTYVNAKCEQHFERRGKWMKQKRYAFPLVVQLTVPDNLYDQEFRYLLELLRDEGFYGVELNILDFGKYKPQDYTNYLNEFDLNMTMVATGAYAVQNGLSLSSSDPQVRKRSVKEVKMIVDFAAQISAGAICGFMKGAAETAAETAKSFMRDSLLELSQYVLQQKTNLLIEATNHYESSVALTVGETVQLIKELNNPFLQVLPDTYHMNIEERDTAFALLNYKAYYRSVHISDNNRYFPGFGGIDFYKVMALLKASGFCGTITMEGKTYCSLEQDILFSAKYLQNVSERLEYL